MIFKRWYSIVCKQSIDVFSSFICKVKSVYAQKRRRKHAYKTLIQHNWSKLQTLMSILEARKSEPALHLKVRALYFIYKVILFISYSSCKQIHFVFPETRKCRLQNKTFTDKTLSETEKLYTYDAHTLSIWCRSAWSYHCPSDICKIHACIWSRVIVKRLMINLFLSVIYWW